MLATAIRECAQHFARYIDARGLTPEALAVAIGRGEPVILRAVHQIPDSTVALMRQMFGGVVGELQREQTDANGRRYHPYMLVLQEPCLRVQHRAHVDVLLQHLPWYRAQMDAAVQYLRGR